MAIDATAVTEIFERLGAALQKPTMLCLIGSTPGIALGQAERQTPDMDVWLAASDFDTGDLAKACREAGILFDPRGEIDPDHVYLQIVRPGIVRLPGDFVPELIGRFGRLTVGMPPPEYLAAAKLVRGSEIDIDDVVWWVRQRGLGATDIEHAIAKFPNERDREAALSNMSFVQLVTGGDWS
jgi:hypothetical protein